MRRLLHTFLFAVAAGICIGLGGTVFLQVNDGSTVGKVLGALLFTVGLFTICTRGYNLYTGKACYLFDNPPSYVLDLLVIWVGNLVGCWLLATVERATRIFSLSEAAQALVTVKMEDSLISLFLLGLVCNIFIYIAVNGFQKNPHELGKYLCLFLGVSCFILCGTEHSVADMYYWCMSGLIWNGHSLLCLVVISLGNLVGGLILPLLEKAKAKLSA